MRLTGTFVSRRVTRIGTRMNSGGILLTLSNNMSSSIITTLLVGTVNGRLIYIRMGRNLVHGSRSRGIVGLFGSRVSTGLVCISTASEFLSLLTNITSPREGHGVVNTRFVGIFTSRTEGLGSVSFLTRNAVCPSVLRDMGRTRNGGTIGSRRGINNLPRSLGFRLMRPLGLLFGSRIHIINGTLNLPSGVICHRPFPNPNLNMEYLNTVAHSELSTLHRTSTVLHSRFSGYKLTKGI